MQTSARYVLILLVGISALAGGYRYGVKGIWADASQWDLSSHIRGVQQLLSEKPEKPLLKPPFVPPYLPLAFPLLVGFGALPWDFARLLWLSLSIFTLGWLMYFTLRHLPSNLSVSLSLCVALSIALFKGSWLALAAGQMSLLIIFLLVWSFDNHKGHQWLSLIALAIATLKLTLAAPFFLFLLLRGQIARAFFAGFAALLIQLPAMLIFPDGPLGYWRQFRVNAAAFESIGVNSYLLMGTSGRVDLAPLAAVFGVEGAGLLLLLVSLAVVGLLLLYRFSDQMDDLTLLLLTNILFFLLTYHRAYDLIILLVLGIPVLWKYRRSLPPILIIALLPFALPLQLLLSSGMSVAPQLELFWHFIACSTPISLICVSVWLLRKTAIDRL